MSDFDYKKYSLEHLENWIHDALNAAEATPSEIYSVIIRAIEEERDYHRNNLNKVNELLRLMRGNRPQKNDLPSEDGIYFTQNPVFYPEYSDEVLEAMCEKAAKDDKERRSKYTL